MNQSEAEHYSRLLEQYQDVFLFIVATQDQAMGQVPVGQLAQHLNIRNPLAGGLFGFITLAIVHSYDWIAKPEQFPRTILAAVDMTVLNPTINVVHANETVPGACFRHLRNCFAHGHFEFALPGTTMIRLWDEDRGVRTFELAIDATVFSPIAMAVMRAAHAHATNIAFPPPPPAPPVP